MSKTSLSSPSSYSNARALQPFFILEYISEDGSFSADISDYCLKGNYEEQSFLVNQLVVTLKDGENVFDRFGIRAGGLLKISFGDMSSTEADFLGRRDNSFGAKTEDSFGEIVSNVSENRGEFINYREKFIGPIKVIKTQPQDDTGEFHLEVTALQAPSLKATNIAYTFSYPDSSPYARPSMVEYLKNVYGSRYTETVPKIDTKIPSAEDLEKVQKGELSVPAASEILNANFISPVDPTKNTFWVSSGFGLRGAKNHDGIDLAVSKNTPIRAAADGTITKVLVQRDKYGNVTGYGYYVVMEHIIDGKKYRTLYAHLANDSVFKNLSSKIGTFLSKGGFLANSDKTGTSSGKTGYHLHFEIQENISGNTFEAVDPEKYIKFREISSLGSNTSSQSSPILSRSTTNNINEDMYISLRELIALIAVDQGYYVDDRTVLVDDSILFTLESPAMQVNKSDHSFLTELALNSNCTYWNEVYNDKTVLFFVDNERIEEASIITPDGTRASKRNSYNFYYPRRVLKEEPNSTHTDYVYSEDIKDFKSRTQNGQTLFGGTFQLRNLNISEDIGLLDKIDPKASNLNTRGRDGKEVSILESQASLKEGLFLTPETLLDIVYEDNSSKGFTNTEDFPEFRRQIEEAVESGLIVQDEKKNKLIQFPNKYIINDERTGEAIGIFGISFVDMSMFVRGYQQLEGENSTYNKPNSVNTYLLPKSFEIINNQSLNRRFSESLIFAKQAIPFQNVLKPSTFDWRGVRITGTVDGNVNIIAQSWHNIFGITKYSSIINAPNTRYFLRALTTTFDESGNFETKLEFFQ